MDKPFSIAPFSPTASVTPPEILPLIAPHLKSSLPAKAASRAACCMSPVRTAVAMNAGTPDFAASSRPRTALSLAAIAKIMLTAGAPTPADTTETVTHTKITPVPIATLRITRS